MIVVMEVWELKPGLAARALQIMQEMDDLVEPPAHRNAGWCGHARFYQSATDPGRILMIYPWRSREQHERLRASEEPLLASIYAEYCQRPREIVYFTELPVAHAD